MPMYVIGRGEELMAVGEAYRKFLVALAHGEPSDELKSLLRDADTQLSLLLSRKSSGGTEK